MLLGKNGKMTRDQIQLIHDTYAGKKVFLTGHTGFKGSWLLCWLRHLNAIVKGYSLNPDFENSLYTRIDGDARCQSVIADIRDTEKVREEILSFKPDFIFHLAAQPLVRYSYQEPVETFNTNIMGTVHVLDAVRYLNQDCSVILITTDKVYENQEWIYPYREHEPLGGFDPYSASKGACELIINSYRRSFFQSDSKDFEKAIASARAGNVIGGGDWASDRIIPDLVRAFSKHETLAIRNSFAVRPWQHVLDPLFGYLLLGAKMRLAPSRFSEAWNFGPYAEDSLTVRQLVELTQKYWQGEVVYMDEKNQPHEAGLLKLDINKAITKLGWYPHFSSEQSIQKTIEWYKAVIEVGEPAHVWVEKQILQYENQ